MADPHARFEEYALAHVLGGLPQQESALFRTHLADCRECRMRVAELRDIAAELASAEREERRRAAVATRVAELAEDDDEATGRWLGPPPRWAQLAAVVVFVAVLGVLFWNYHLRRVAATYAGTVARQSAVLDVLADGEAREVDGDGGVRGVAAIDDGTLAVTLTGMPHAAHGQVIVGWLLDRQDEPIERFGLAPSDDGTVPFTTDLRGAAELLVTVEASPPGDTPRGPHLARVELRTAN